MKTIKAALAAVVTALVLASFLPAALADPGSGTIANCSAALKAMSQVQKEGIPPEIYREAQGVALFCGLKKADFQVSGRVGKGVLLVRDGEGKWSNPVLVTLSGGTLGWQIVGEPMDILLVIKDKKTLEAMLKGKFMLGGNTGVVAGPLGRSLKGAGKAELKAEINSYVLSQGAFADVSVATTTLQVAPGNDAYYGGNKVSAQDIVSGKLAKNAPEIANLKRLVGELAAKK